MRVLGGLMFAIGAAATAYAVRGIYASGRPRDLVYALGAPVAVALAVLGLVLLFVPGFLQSAAP